jgi:hypothetical protein
MKCEDSQYLLEDILGVNQWKTCFNNKDTQQKEMNCKEETAFNLYISSTKTFLCEEEISFRRQEWHSLGTFGPYFTQRLLEEEKDM